MTSRSSWMTSKSGWMTARMLWTELRRPPHFWRCWIGETLFASKMLGSACLRNGWEAWVLPQTSTSGTKRSRHRTDEKKAGKAEKQAGIAVSRAARSQELACRAKGSQRTGRQGNTQSCDRCTFKQMQASFFNKKLVTLSSLHLFDDLLLCMCRPKRSKN